MHVFGPEVTRERDLMIIATHVENRMQSLQWAETSCILCLDVAGSKDLAFGVSLFSPQVLLLGTSV